MSRADREARRAKMRARGDYAALLLECGPIIGDVLSRVGRPGDADLTGALTLYARELLPRWDPEKGNLRTFLHTWLHGRAMRILSRDRAHEALPDDLAAEPESEPEEDEALARTRAEAIQGRLAQLIGEEPAIAFQLRQQDLSDEARRHRFATLTGRSAFSLHRFRRLADKAERDVAALTDADRDRIEAAGDEAVRNALEARFPVRREVAPRLARTPLALTYRAPPNSSPTSATLSSPASPPPGRVRRRSANHTVARRGPPQLTLIEFNRRQLRAWKKKRFLTN